MSSTIWCLRESEVPWSVHGSVIVGHGQRIIDQAIVRGYAYGKQPITWFASDDFPYPVRAKSELVTQRYTKLDACKSEWRYY